MKNWFMSQSIAVRVAMIVLAVAVVAGAGTGIALLATRSSSDDRTVAEVKDDEKKEESPVIQDEPVEEPEEDVVEITTPVETIEEVVEEVVEEEVINLSYSKTSTKLENGSFTDGLDAWEVYSYVEDNIDYTADGTFSLTMNETGTEDWHVQLKQTGIRLEKGKWYTISFDAKSTLGRSILCSMQRDGMIHNDDWTPYANAKEYVINNGWKTYTYTFQMNENTDNAAVLMFSFGAVNGKKITKEHTILIDNVKLTQLADNWTESLKVGDNLIGNADFAYGSTLWDASVVAPGASSVSFDGNKAAFGITNVGTIDWHVQLKQSGIKLENNTGYRLTFTVSSNVQRTIKIGFMDSDYINWYGGGDVVLNGTANQQVTVDFYNNLGANANAQLMISMGLIDGVATPAGNIELSNFNLVKCEAVNASSSSNGGGYKDPNYYLSEGWIVYDHENGHVGAVTDTNGVISVAINNIGSQDWHVQLQHQNTTLVEGKYYKISFDVKSTLARKIGVSIQHNGNLTNDDNWTAYTPNDTATYAVGTDWSNYAVTFKMNEATDTVAVWNISLGMVNGASVDPHTIAFKNLKIVEVEPPTIVDRTVEVGGQVLNGDGAINSTTYNVANCYNNNSISINDGSIVVKVNNPGVKDYEVQVKQANVPLEKGAEYKVTLNLATTSDRVIKVGFMSDDGKYDWYGGSDINIAVNGENPYEFTFTSPKSDAHGMMCISMGQIEDVDTPTGTITITGISVVKTKDASGQSDGMTLLPLGVDPNNPTQYKGSVTFNPADYVEGDYIGKTLVVSIKVKAETWFGGAICGASTATQANNGWFNGTQRGYDNGGAYTWEQEIPAASGNVELAIWWSGADSVKYSDVTMSIKDDNNNPQEPSEPGDNNDGMTLLPLGVDPDNPTQYKGSVTFNPADYVEGDYIGKTLVVSIKVKAETWFGGAICGSSSSEQANDGWFNGTQKGYDNGGTYTWEQEIPAASGNVELAIWWSGADSVKYSDVTMSIKDENNNSQEPGDDPGDNPPATNYTRVDKKENNKGEFVLDPAAYGLTGDLSGKKIKMTVTLESNQGFNGTIGGNAPEGSEQAWMQDNVGFSSEDGSRITYSYTWESYNWYAKIDFWWINTYVDIVDVKMELIPRVDKKENNKGEFVLDPANYGLTGDLSGKKIKMTVTLESNQGFNGTIGGNAPAGSEQAWMQDNVGFSSEDGSRITYSYTWESYNWYAKIDFWWINTYVDIVEVKMELVE